jgi:predicted nucleic acid-binding protein
VAGIYVDTSALGRVLLGEPDGPAVLATLDTFDQHVASRLLRVELRRLALRARLLDHADQLLAAVALVPLDDAILEVAETIPPEQVGTLDAIHLVTALRLADAGAIDAVLTYDVRLAGGARQHGLTALAPTP